MLLQGFQTESSSSPASLTCLCCSVNSWPCFHPETEQ